MFCVFLTLYVLNLFISEWISLEEQRTITGSLFINRVKNFSSDIEMLFSTVESFLNEMLFMNPKSQTIFNEYHLISFWSQFKTFNLH